MWGKGTSVKKMLPLEWPVGKSVEHWCRRMQLTVGHSWAGGPRLYKKLTERASKQHLLCSLLQPLPPGSRLEFLSQLPFVMDYKL